MRFPVANRAFLGRMLALMLPIALQNLLMSSFALINSVMVARLGDEAITAVSFASRWVYILQITLFGISSGAAILYSQFWGAEDKRGIRQIFGLSAGITLAASLLFTVLMATMPETLIRLFAGPASEGTVDAVVQMGSGYLRVFAIGCPLLALNTLVATSMRSTEEARIPLLTTLLSITVNTILNYGLIYGNFGMPALGVPGAAAATVVANAMQFALLIVLGRKRHIIFAAVRDWFAFDKALLLKYLGVGLPVIASDVLWVLGNSVYTFVFGRQYIGEVAAFSIYLNIDSLLYAFILGANTACGVLVGKAVGAGNKREAWDTARNCLLIGLVLSVLLGAVEALVRVPLVQLVGPRTQETALLAQRLLLLASFLMPIKMASIMLVVAIFRSGGRPVLGAVLDVGCVLLIGAPLVSLVGFLVQPPFPVLFMLMFTEDIVKVALGFIVFRRRTWMRQLTAEKTVFKPVAVPLGE